MPLFFPRVTIATQVIEKMDMFTMLLKLLTFCSYVFSLLKIAISLPIAIIGFVVLSFWHEKSDDPNLDFMRKHMNKTRKTPILLLHGSNANQQQWFLFRKWLSSDDVGHVFSLNMNKARRCDDHNRDVLDYAESVHQKLVAIKKLYSDCGVDITSIILIGNSMGGLVAGAYCISDYYDMEDTVKVEAVITISTPWGGTKIADWFCNKNKYPEKYFCTDSIDRKNLVEKVLQFSNAHGVSVYNYGSMFDLLVPLHSSHIPEVPKKHQHQDYRNDHWTTMLDRKLAIFVREKWVKPNTSNFV